ncbi:unnamed protein product [Echinostoma caproni]|uniref:Uncharacterized protein n=1 Tax=Echinostoma caproni TaxID=27848 RepID=A0A183A321_9TREM|nr:unnamed protein product [Echinostoma caproni]
MPTETNQWKATHTEPERANILPRPARGPRHMQVADYRNYLLEKKKTSRGQPPYPTRQKLQEPPWNVWPKPNRTQSVIDLRCADDTNLPPAQFIPDSVDTVDDCLLTQYEEEDRSWMEQTSSISMCSSLCPSLGTATHSMTESGFPASEVEPWEFSEPGAFAQIIYPMHARLKCHLFSPTPIGPLARHSWLSSQETVGQIQDELAAFILQIKGKRWSGLCHGNNSFEAELFVF